MSNATTATRTRHRLPCAAATALVALSLGGLPAHARQDPGLPDQPSAATSSTFATDGRCPLRRVGTQYVRCDNLTGNGVAAPGWLLEH